MSHTAAHRTAGLLAAIILAITGLTMATTTEAHADEVLLSEPSIAYPLINADGTVAHRVIVEAPRLSWQVRRAARYYDAAIPGLTIETGACVTGVPCIRVHVGSWDPARQAAVTNNVVPKWSGLTMFDNITDRTILLNRYSTSRPWRFRVASHEIGHALGLDHNSLSHALMCAGPTCYLRSWVWKPNPAELGTLVAYYSQGATA